MKTAQEAWIDDGPVLLDYADGVATLTLNRPQVANAMNIEMMRGIREAVLHCHTDSRVRVVVLRGAGRNFCSGGDVGEFASKKDGLAPFIREVTANLQAAIGLLVRLDAIVIAAIQGYAAGGGGLGLACAADLVICGQGAKFLAGATRVAMVPDAGSSVMLARIVGFRVAMEMLLTNRTVGADEALAIGLVNRVTPDDALDAEVDKLGTRLAEGAPLAQAATKRLLWNGVGLDVESCLPEEARTQSYLAGTDDAREGLLAVIDKRKPDFVGR